MGKLTGWQNPNWFWDQGWKKKEVLALIRRNWKQCKKTQNVRDRAEARERRQLKLTPHMFWDINDAILNPDFSLENWIRDGCCTSWK